MKQVAVTIDDLPIHGETENTISRFDIASRFIEAFQKYQMPPVYGFVNGCFVERDSSYDQILRFWVDYGNFLGNHTYSHPDIRTLTSKIFISDIKKNENILSRYSEKKDYKFFVTLICEKEKPKKSKMPSSHF